MLPGMVKLNGTLVTEDRDGWLEDVLYLCFEMSEVDIAFVPTKRFKKLELTSEKHHFLLDSPPSSQSKAFQQRRPVNQFPKKRKLDLKQLLIFQC